MKCKDCGAELPFNSYGDIRCQFCNAQNYVPVPEKEVIREVEKKGSSTKWDFFIKLMLVTGAIIILIVVSWFI